MFSSLSSTIRTFFAIPAPVPAHLVDITILCAVMVQQSHHILKSVLTAEAALDASLDPNQVAIDPRLPLLIVDVDEVLGLFMHGFGRFLGTRGYEFRTDRFALFQNIFAPGAEEHLDLESGRVLFDLSLI